ncbi:MAG: MFS transporter [Chloroflexi bacterium]|nr:MFS transporter [Chloroflexota bacterium]
MGPIEPPITSFLHLKSGGSMKTRYRWYVVAVCFLFMLLHQADKLLIGPLTSSIMETYGIDEEQMGRVFTGALVVGAVFYPLWGYLYDRYSRSKLLALASFLWGASTWLSAVAPNYGAFLATRASTGIDDSSYPGLYSLISDYFGPHVRGRIFGLLQITMPIGYLLGMVLAMTLQASLGWRNVFYITGSLGILLSILIALGVREAPRGQSEPELADLAEFGAYRFSWKAARGLLKTRSLLLLFAQGFFGVFPWNVITYWFFRYLETERGFSSDAVLITMVVAVLVLACGYFVGGTLGDMLFKRTTRGRLIVCIVGVLSGAVLLLATFNVPVGNQVVFGVLLSATALFIPFAASNVVSTVHDVTLPEIRSTALAVQYFVESAGAALAPWLAGYIAVRSSLGDAILWICVVSWLICALFFVLAVRLLPGDVASMRVMLRERASQARAELAVEPGVGSLEPGGKGTFTGLNGTA